MDALYWKHPTRSKRQLAEELSERYQAEDDSKPPSAKTLQHIWHKPE